MLSSNIEHFFTQMSAASISEFFTYLIFLLFIFALILSFRKRRNRFLEYAPNLMTSLGILGTFIGIVIGLLGFDTSDISGSIPLLLEGLKTAFITSILGLIGAISFNFLDTILFAKLRADAEEEHYRDRVTPESIYGVMLEQTQLTRTLNRTISDLSRTFTKSDEQGLLGEIKLMRASFQQLPTLLNQFKEGVGSAQQEQNRLLLQMRHDLQYLHTRIGGEEGDSLIGQMKISRVDTLNRLHNMELVITPLAETLKEESKQKRQALLEFKDNFAQFSQTLQEKQKSFEIELFNQLSQFAQMMSRSATEQIIEALKNVIEDFNKHITEQFGDNFKALDASVQKLVIWQEQYRRQLESMGAQYEESVESLKESRSALREISTGCESIPNTMSHLEEVIGVSQHQIAQLEQHLEAFVAMRDEAVKAVPTITEQVSDVTTRLSATTDQLSQVLAQSGEQLGEAIREAERSLSSVSSEVIKSSTQISGMLNESTTHLEQESRTLLNNIRQSSNEMAGSYEQVTQIMNGFTQELRESFEKSRSTFESHLQDSAEKTGNTVNAQLEQLEIATAREIEKAMQEMGNALVQITGRFVEDYEALVKGMEQVINHGRGY